MLLLCYLHVSLQCWFEVNVSRLIAGKIAQNIQDSKSKNSISLNYFEIFNESNTFEDFEMAVSSDLEVLSNQNCITAISSPVILHPHVQTGATDCLGKKRNEFRSLELIPGKVTLPPPSPDI